jgi:hypothetical protein
MPFDCTPITETPKQLLAVGDDLLGFAPSSRQAEPARPRPIPAWHSSRRSDNIGGTLAVLGRARQLIADEQRWCQGSFARTWLKIPVPVQSGTARRFCTIGAVMRACDELGLPSHDACIVLEWQTVRPVQDWNNDPQRTHADVIATFDAATIALETSAG